MALTVAERMTAYRQRLFDKRIEDASPRVAHAMAIFMRLSAEDKKTLQTLQRRAT